jgi:hypothetical protein
VLTVRQVNIDTPGQPGHTSPHHTYLTSREVIARFRWGRTFGYQMLASTGFPRTIGGRYRLDTLIAWEDRVLSGELTGRPDPRDDQADAAPRQITEPDEVGAAADGDVLIAAPTRRRTRGLGRAA